MKAKVLLMTPPYHCGVVEAAGTWVPLALASVAGGLSRAGYEVEIYDAMAKYSDWAAIEEKLRSSNPDFVGTTAFTATVNDAVRALALAKRVKPGVVTLLGGIHPNFQWKELLEAEDSPVDYVVRGEGEVTAPRLLDAITCGEPPERVRGIALRDASGRAFATASRPLIEDLDAHPAAWELLDWKDYTFYPRPGSVSGLISSSRGCTEACSFCSQQKFWSQSWRAKSPEAFVGEIELLRKEFGVSIAMVADETPTKDRARWRRILDLLIARKLDFELMLETRVDDILRDRDWLDDYRRAGIMHIYVGVESGSQETLDTFKKNLKTEQSKEAIKLINEAGIISETAFVLGMPGETPESIRRTTDLALEYGPDMAFFMAIAPWPYSDIYRELKPLVETDDYSLYNLVRAVVKPRAMTRAEVEAELASAFRKFYMHRLKGLEKMPPFKREYMLAVTRLLASHSYLKEQMKGMGGSAGMPEEVLRVLGAAGVALTEAARPGSADKKHA
ncbi:MAG: cobalamin-dependent protein [Elusimicrobia bacterium]|nr:cobalamin-dependent protein [Elusimicrobiota bacterium]